MVHIADISRAFIAAIEAPRETVHSQIFNVGITTENYLVREIAEIVRRTVPGSSITYAEGAGPDVFRDRPVQFQAHRHGVALQGVEVLVPITTLFFHTSPEVIRVTT